MTCATCLNPVKVRNMKGSRLSSFTISTVAVSLGRNRNITILGNYPDTIVKFQVSNRAFEMWRCLNTKVTKRFSGFGSWAWKPRSLSWPEKKRWDDSAAGGVMLRRGTSAFRIHFVLAKECITIYWAVTKGSKGPWWLADFILRPSYIGILAKNWYSHVSSRSRNLNPRSSMRNEQHVVGFCRFFVALYLIWERNIFVVAFFSQVEWASCRGKP